MGRKKKGKPSQGDGQESQAGPSQEKQREEEQGGQKKVEKKQPQEQQVQQLPQQPQQLPQQQPQQLPEQPIRKKKVEQQVPQQLPKQVQQEPQQQPSEQQSRRKKKGKRQQEGDVEGITPSVSTAQGPGPTQVQPQKQGKQPSELQPSYQQKQQTPPPTAAAALGRQLPQQQQAVGRQPPQQQQPVRPAWQQQAQPQAPHQPVPYPQQPQFPQSPQQPQFPQSPQQPRFSQTHQGQGRGGGGRGGERGGRQQRQYEGPRQSVPTTPEHSPYSMTPASSTSSITQAQVSQEKQIGDTAAAMQRVSLKEGQQRTPPTATGRPTGGVSPSDILPQTSVQRRGGTECRARTKVITNYFPLNIGKLARAIHYDVDITPDRPKKLFRPVMEEFRKKRYGNRWPAYDGNKNLYSASALLDSAELSDTVTVTEDDRQKEFKVTIKFATYVDLTQLQNYVERFHGRHIRDMEKPMQALQCLDVVLRSAPALSCIPVGRSYFTPPTRNYVLGDGCILYYGFYQAAILGWKPFVNIDVAHKAFPSSSNMIELVMEMCPRADLSRELQRFDAEAINKHMRQLKVEYMLPRNPASRRVYRVNQIDLPSRKATFIDDKGKRMTVEKYFFDVKDITLKYPNLPTLWVGSRQRENKILLPFEFCTILPHQAVNKKMTEQQTRNMIKYAATNTEIRLNNIRDSVSKADYNRSMAMKEFGISVDSNPQEVDARILQPPALKYARRVENVSRGVWRASQFCEGAKLLNWTILCLDERTRDDALIRLAQEFINCSGSFGMEIAQPQPHTRLIGRNLSSDLKSYFTKNKNCQMIVVVLSTRSDCYNYVKQASEIAVGCLTQCLKPNTVFRLNRSTVDNILLKINAKLNGQNHGLSDVPACFRRPIMIMGADVTHPGPDSKDFPSVAAVTASLDATAFKYSFEWRLQQSKEEMIQDLAEITRQHLLTFYKRNNKMKPEKILYVRDGVSDGQFVQVLNVELKAIRAACAKLDPSYKPAIIFIVVQKRHHTRFFPKDRRISEDKNFNVPAGTCVDTVITHPSIVDFYLVSHASIQGVAKPTKYVKLWDDCDMSEDEIEKLMYYLCHLFARCNRSVSYPAPTYYAHLAAARARVYCEIDNIDMNNLQREQERLTIKDNIAKSLPMFFV